MLSPVSQPQIDTWELTSEQEKIISDPKMLQIFNELSYKDMSPTDLMSLFFKENATLSLSYDFFQKLSQPNGLKNILIRDPFSFSQLLYVLNEKNILKAFILELLETPESIALAKTLSALQEETKRKKEIEEKILKLRIVLSPQDKEMKEIQTKEEKTPEDEERFKKIQEESRPFREQLELLLDIKPLSIEAYRGYALALIDHP